MAISVLKRAIELEADNPLAYYHMGDASHALNDMVGARAYWNNAHRFDPYGTIGDVASQRLNGQTIKLRWGLE